MGDGKKDYIEPMVYMPYNRCRSLPLIAVFLKIALSRQKRTGSPSTKQNLANCCRHRTPFEQQQTPDCYMITNSIASSI